MPRSRSTARSAAFLLAVASVLALLVGLVGSGGRAISPPRKCGPIQAWEYEAAADVLRMPVVLPPAPGEPVAGKPASHAHDVQARAERVNLTGIVLRPEGEPAAAARVIVGQQHARCDPEGRFELVLPADLGAVDLIAFEPGHEPALRPAFGAQLAAGGEQSIRLVLGAPTLSLAGKVVTADGTPVKGWTVELDGTDPLASFALRERVRSDRDGRFLLPDVPAGVHVLRAWAERREQAFRSAPTAAGESGLSIVVERSR